ncbi:MAG: caspase family protein, partial [Bacteroidota bacterium]
TGEWKNNQRHGKGKMVFEDGTELEGDWEEDDFHADWSSLGFQGDRRVAADCNAGCGDAPNGKYRYPNGTTFYGKVYSSLPAGNGTVDYPNGNTYHGGFNNHQPDGLGIMYYADGEMHGGIWRNGALYRRIFTAMGRPAKNVTPDFDPQVKVWAVVVGAARYTHMRTLKYTDDDAYQLAGFLRSVEGGALPNEQVKVLIDEDATHRNIIMAMRETYQRADENDVILFYFSGHGLKGSFLPVDYDGFVNRLEHYQLRDALLASRARHKLVIADACHSGSLGGRTASPLNAKGIGGGVDATLSAYYDALNNAEASTALLLSSKGEEISLEDGGLRSGIFSHYLIRGMQGEADANGDKLVSIQELFNFVHREVRRYTGNIQTPTLTGTYDELMPVSVIRK